MALRFSLLDGRLHARAAFRCGVPALETYLQQQAGQHHRDGIATTHLLTDDDSPASILGYCSLAAGQLQLHDLQSSDRQRLPSYPVPAVRLARLAVALEERGKGYGHLLLGHAVNCCMSLRSYLGVRLLVVDAIDEQAVAFYRANGFRQTSEDALTLYLSLGRT